jgi:hypothetical protein
MMELYPTLYQGSFVLLSSSYQSLSSAVLPMEMTYAVLRTSLLSTESEFYASVFIAKDMTTSVFTLIPKIRISTSVYLLSFEL